MKTLNVKTIVVLFLLISCSYSHAAVPHLINYQGRLTDSGGAPLSGTYNITFRIYDAETAGNLLWEETQSSVVVQKGVFSILLGSVTALNVLFDKQYFLEIKVGNEVMSPRQRITSSGYAIRAEKAETADQATNAGTVNSIGASATPQANKLLPLDVNAKLPSAAFKVYDSGWFAVSTSASYTKSHNLNTTKAIIQVYISDNSNGSGRCILAHSTDYMTGSQCTIQSLTNTTITLRTWQTIVDFQDANGRWLPTSAYARIVMLALE